MAFEVLFWSGPLVALVAFIGLGESALTWWEGRQ